ncbi:hypothetical protein KKD03_04740 [Patescibacteria group bacterium]|nr:hypothetical protein [Patescibacteria group bacterium]
MDKPYNKNPEPGQESFILRPFGREEKVFEDFGKYQFWYWFDYKTRVDTYQIVVPPRSFTVDFKTITHYGPQDEEWGEVIQFFPEQYVPDGYWY